MHRIDGLAKACHRLTILNSMPDVESWIENRDPPGENIVRAPWYIRSISIIVKRYEYGLLLCAAGDEG